MSSVIVHPAVTATPPKDGKLLAFTLTPAVGETVPELGRRLAVHLREMSAAPIHLQVYGDCRAQPVLAATLRHLLGRWEWPITWVAGSACERGPIAGLQLHAFSGPVQRLVHDGRWVGSVFTDGGAQQCFVGGLMPKEVSLSRPAQTARTLETLAQILSEAGFELTDLVRTWFFLDDILAWYEDFNRARNAIYSGLKFRTGSLPASTGVGAQNPSGGALALAAWAFRPVEKNAYAEEVASPLQCPAPAYGSSFSRALETSSNGGRRLFISGTASIAPGGKTLWAGDVGKQIDLTMQVVEAILHSRGFTLASLSRATAYFRRPGDAPAFAQWLAAKPFSSLPVIYAQCDVCRDDLLFELEAEAMAPH